MSTLTPSTTYEVSEGKVRFLEIIALKEGDSWKYLETGSWFQKQSMGTLYQKFILKAEMLKKNGHLGKTKKILCNAAYAAELLINGIINKEMIESIEEKVAGEGGAMIPMITIPKQNFSLLGVDLKEVVVIIVDCHSYPNFCFIDKYDRDL